MARRDTGYYVLLVLTILFALAALVTFIPVSSASKECFLGYRSHCPFTPVSTLVCLAGAAVTCIIRARRSRTKAADAADSKPGHEQ